MTSLPPQKIGPLEFNMLPIPGGSFRMGSKKDDKEAFNQEKPDHDVRVSDFSLAEYPVTQDLWLEVMGGENPSFFQGERRPVEQVSWYDALVFCNRLSLRCGRSAAYLNPDGSIYGQIKGRDDAWELPNAGDPYWDSKSDGYRLPTEAEWEYASRGGTPSLVRRAGVGSYAGSDKLKEVGWFEDNSHGETKPVGLKQPNALGLYDMSGNVWEWCEDDWHDNYKNNPPTDGSAWIDKPNQGSYRVFRGGGWLYAARYCRSAYRGHWYPGDRGNLVGFRLCLAPQSVG